MNTSRMKPSKVTRFLTRHVTRSDYGRIALNVCG
jgi:hypothetical protein